MNKKVLLIAIACTVCNDSLYGMLKNKMLFNKKTVSSIAALWKQKSFTRINKNIPIDYKHETVRYLDFDRGNGLERNIRFDMSSTYILDQVKYIHYCGGEDLCYERILSASTLEPVDKNPSTVDWYSGRKLPRYDKNWNYLNNIYYPHYSKENEQYQDAIVFNDHFIIFSIGNRKDWPKHQALLCNYSKVKNFFLEFKESDIIISPLPKNAQKPEAYKILFARRGDKKSLNMEFITDLGDGKYNAGTKSFIIDKTGQKILIIDDDKNFSLLQVKNNDDPSDKSKHEQNQGYSTVKKHCFSPESLCYKTNRTCGNVEPGTLPRITENNTFYGMYAIGKWTDHCPCYRKIMGGFNPENSDNESGSK